MENKELINNNREKLDTIHSIVCRVIDRVSIKLSKDTFSPLQDENNRVNIVKNNDLAAAILVNVIRNKYKI